MRSTASRSPGVGRLPNPSRSRGRARARSNTVRRCRARYATTRCSRTVSSSNSSSRWKVRARPRRARACGDAFVTSTPSIRTVPPRRPDQSGQHAEEGALARAVRADEADDPPRRHRETHVIERDETPEPDRHVGGVDDRCRHRVGTHDTGTGRVVASAGTGLRSTRLRRRARRRLAESKRMPRGSRGERDRAEPEEQRRQVEPASREVVGDQLRDDRERQTREQCTRDGAHAPRDDDRQPDRAEQRVELVHVRRARRSSRTSRPRFPQ